MQPRLSTNQTCNMERATETLWASVSSSENWCNGSESIVHSTSTFRNANEIFWMILMITRGYRSTVSVSDVVKGILFLNEMTFHIINVMCGSHLSLDPLSHNWCLISILSLKFCPCCFWLPYWKMQRSEPDCLFNFTQLINYLNYVVPLN